MTFTFQELIAVVGAVAGLIALFLQYRRAPRSDLQDRFVRMKRERNESGREAGMRRQAVVEL